MAEEKKVEDLAIKKETVKPLEVSIPDDILKIMDELKVKKDKLVNQFLNISFQVGEMQDKQDEIRNQVKSTDEKIGQKVQYAFNQLKLKKRKNYRWGYNSKERKFVGNLIPEKPKKENG